MSEVKTTPRTGARAAQCAAVLCAFSLASAAGVYFVGVEIAKAVEAQLSHLRPSSLHHLPGVSGSLQPPMPH